MDENLNNNNSSSPPNSPNQFLNPNADRMVPKYSNFLYAGKVDDKVILTFAYKDDPTAPMAVVIERIVIDINQAVKINALLSEIINNDEQPENEQHPVI